MREIKFRAWNKERKEMLLPTLIKLTTEGITNISCNGKDNVEYFNIGQVVELMQFTGLKDSKGIEIYEGDIVKGYFKTEEVESWIYLILTEEEKRTGTKLFKIEIPDFYQRPMPDDLEVIGNVYENPELLKE